MPSGPRHHTTQRYHLAQFTGDQPKGQVWIYDKTTGRARSDIPENISVENNFYSIENEDGSWDTRLDDWITNVEGTAKPVYDRLLAGDIPPYSQAKYDFSLYLALTYLRTKTQRRVVTETYGKMLQNVMARIAQEDEWFEKSMANFEEERGKPMPPERRQQMRDIMLNPVDKFKLTVSKNIGFAAWGAIDKLAPLFLHMHWTVLTPQNGFFITSDNPLLQLNPVGSRHPIYGDGGFLNKAVEVSFPLSPRRLLLLTHKSRAKSTYQVPRQIVENINEARAAQCERELYSHIESKKIVKLAEEHMNNRPKMVIGGGLKSFAEVVSPRRFHKKR